MIRLWHDVRADLESGLYNLTKDATIKTGTTGKHKPDLFLGHCSQEGSKGYVHMEAREGTYAQLPKLYNDPAAKQ